MKVSYIAALTGFGICLAQPSNAAVIQSLDRATFQTALASANSIGLQDFDGLASGSTLTNDGFVSYTSSIGLPLVTNAFLTSSTPNGLGRTDFGYFLPGDTLLLTFANSISAFAIDINTFSTQPGSYTASLNTGDVISSRFEAFSGTSTGQFIGFISNTPFSSVLLNVGASGGNAFSLDTLVYGKRDDVIGAVPEASTWAMMILGFGFVGFAMRRRTLIKMKVSYN